jgi:AraC-like DNA-binding protein
MTPPRAPVTTVLLPVERLHVDAACEGLYQPLHRDRIDEAVADLRASRASAILMSVGYCTRHGAARVASLVREFPRVPAVALLTDMDDLTPQAVLTLGRCGVRALVDVRRPSGWRELRALLLSDRAAEIDREASALVSLDLAQGPAECRRFFEVLFASASRVSTVRALCRELGAVPSTLMSRFFRARLPAPKRYLAMARLIRAARLLENPGLSIADAANHLDYSSPQSFGRHVRTLLRVTAGDFRERYDGAAMISRFRADLVLPYLATLRRFNPLGTLAAASTPRGRGGRRAGGAFRGYSAEPSPRTGTSTGGDDPQARRVAERSRADS